MTNLIAKSITSQEAPQLQGPSSAAIKLGDAVYIAAQYPLLDDDNSLTHQTMSVIRNLVAILAEMNLELRHIVKTTLYITDQADLEEIDLIYATYFSYPYPARSVILVSGLLNGANVAIDAMAIDTLTYESQFNIHQYNSEDYPEHSCAECLDGTCLECES